MPPIRHVPDRARFALVILSALLCSVPLGALAQTIPLHERVEIRPTSFGVRHILADDLAAAFFGLAYYARARSSS